MSAWSRPVDLRERLLDVTRRGTNLDPNGDTRDHTNTIEAEAERNRERARQHYRRASDTLADLDQGGTP